MFFFRIVKYKVGPCLPRTLGSVIATWKNKNGRWVYGLPIVVNCFSKVLTRPDPAPIYVEAQIGQNSTFYGKRNNMYIIFLWQILSYTMLLVGKKVILVVGNR